MKGIYHGITDILVMYFSGETAENYVKPVRIPDVLAKIGNAPFANQNVEEFLHNNLFFCTNISLFEFKDVLQN